MPDSVPDRPLTKEESYVERRQLFKNIWETAMRIDEKDDIMNKPKVIKTLRMDEIDKCPIGKTKKQRIKNLRHVCNRILDFCDRQEADDQLYTQMTSSDGKPRQEMANVSKPKKMKLRAKRKVRKAKSMFEPFNKITVARVSVSERKQIGLTDENAILSGISSSEKGKLTPTKSATLKKKSVKIKPSPEKKNPRRTKTDDIPREATATPTTKRKIVKKKRGKKKKGSGPKTGSPHVISV